MRKKKIEYKNYDKKLIQFFISISDIIASFISSSEDNIKTYDILINALLIIPDYALSHAISCVLLTYVKQHEAKIEFNFGELLLRKLTRKVTLCIFFNFVIIGDIDPYQIGPNSNRDPTGRSRNRVQKIWVLSSGCLVKLFN